MRAGRLPLGVDIGASRVRVAYAQRDRAGAAHLIAVAARDVEAECGRCGRRRNASRVVEELGREIGARRSQCRDRRAALGSVAQDRALSEDGVGRAPSCRGIRGGAVAGLGLKRRADAGARARRQSRRAAACRRRGPRTGALGSGWHPQTRRLSNRRRGLQPLSRCAARSRLADAVLDIGLRRSVLYGFGAHGPLAIENSWRR